MDRAKRKKKDRPIFLCNSCHIKKRRCDRKFPCSHCIRLGIDLACTYDRKGLNKDNSNTLSVISESELGIMNKNDPLELNSFLLEKVNSLTKKVASLEQIIFNKIQKQDPSVERDPNLRASIKNYSWETLFKLFQEGGDPCQLGNPSADPKYTIAFHHGGSLRRNSHIRWMSYLPQNDPVSRVVAQLLRAPASKRVDFSSPREDSIALGQIETEKIKEKSVEIYGNMYIKELTINSPQTEVIDVKSSISAFASKEGVIFHLEQDFDSKPLKNQIFSVLPSGRTISKLIDVFFTYIYPQFPFLNETTFRMDLVKLFSAPLSEFKEGDSTDEIVIETREQLAVMSTLLVILRMSYIVVQKNPLEPYNIHRLDTKTYDVLSDPVTLDSIRVSERCIKVLEGHEESTATVQAIVMMYIYHSLRQEESIYKSGNPNEITISRIIDFAKTAFHKKGPENPVEHILQSDEEKRNFAIIWLVMFQLDLERSISHGVSLETSKDDYYQTIRDLDSRESVSRNAQYLSPVLHQLHEVITQAYNMDFETDLYEFLPKVTSLEDNLLKRFGKYSGYFNQEENSSKLTRLREFKVYSYSKCFLGNLFNCLYLYYDNKREWRLSAYYLEKTWSIVFRDFSMIHGFMKVCDTILGPGSFFFLKLLVETVIQLQILLFGIVVRIRCSLYCMSVNQESNSDNKKVLFQMLDSFDFHKDLMLSSMTKMCKRSAKIWKLSRGFRYGLNILSNGEFASISNESMESSKLNYSTDLLQGLATALYRDQVQVIYAEELFDRIVPSIDNFNLLEDQSLNAKLEHLQVDRMWRLFEVLKGIDGNRKFMMALLGKDNVEDLHEQLPMDISNFEENLFKDFVWDDVFRGLG